MLDDSEDAAHRRGLRSVLDVDVDGRIVAEQSFTPADWAALNINHGATFNLAAFGSSDRNRGRHIMTRFTT